MKKLSSVQLVHSLIGNMDGLSVDDYRDDVVFPDGLALPSCQKKD